MNFLLEINYCTKCVLIREVTGWLAEFVRRRLRAPYCECPPDDMFPIMMKEMAEVSPLIKIAKRIDDGYDKFNGDMRKNYVNEKLVDGGPPTAGS